MYYAHYLAKKNSIQKAVDSSKRVFLLFNQILIRRDAVYNRRANLSDIKTTQAVSLR